LLPLSVEVTCSVGDEDVPLEKAKKLDTYGPPVGVVTVVPVNVQPVEVPPRVPNWLDAGPEAGSVSVFVILNEHFAATWISAAQFGPVPRYHTVFPEPG
jgi:hypothetical protein